MTADLRLGATISLRSTDLPTWKQSASIKSQQKCAPPQATKLIETGRFDSPIFTNRNLSVSTTTGVYKEVREALTAFRLGSGAYEMRCLKDGFMANARKVDPRASVHASKQFPHEARNVTLLQFVITLPSQTRPTEHIGYYDLARIYASRVVTTVFLLSPGTPFPKREEDVIVAKMTKRLIAQTS